MGLTGVGKLTRAGNADYGEKCGRDSTLSGHIMLKSSFPSENTVVAVLRRPIRYTDTLQILSWCTSKALEANETL